MFVKNVNDDVWTKKLETVKSILKNITQYVIS